MGLFDIFRRRAKKEPESQAPESTAPTSSAETPASAVAAPTSEAVTAESSSAVDSSAASSASAETKTPASSTATSDEAPAASSAASEPESAAEKATTTETESTSEATPTPDSAASEAAVTPAEPTPESAVASVSEATPAEETAEPDSVASAATEPAATEATTSEAPATAEPATTENPVPAESVDQPVSDEQLYDKGLEKTRHTFGERLNALLANFRHVDESFFDDLEETLIGADVGFDMAVKLSDELRDEVKLQNAKKSADVQNVVVEKLVEIYDAAGNDESTALNMAKEGPTVILFVGVNGVGKTTTIGKMANRYHQAGKKVLLAAADTFRAGATEQLDVWAKRADVDIVTGKPQSDPAAVVFDAVRKAKEEDYDILFVDTAGRLQNKVNLMNELAKMKRIITREIPTAPHEVLLVLDATTGQNALTQAKLFKESTDVTGIVLTKLDGTARGGIVLAIRNELHVPVKFIGLGEQISDLRPFDPNEFVYGLFKGLIDVKALEKSR
ncbi:signal recognition particle-docking protein FtsY [Levilactobacillus parabrevis]|uniref:Signal recognition particle receptor FtsY n=1 Tax=Levilactobacillus parabrevis ATCC 53295 TaxID=1267003 RepID=A0A0R1GRF0_9LACO|nr:signal recognition particle-docking protein FtsY [Levilactobacillus parabrevis]KRK36668.1 Signal recognition particle GTPase [Levilactobacillus parabrevis ATCC 53295]KRO06344.1 Signal recognition particle GTPase [Levilactobacillus parabrevis]